MGGVYHVMRKNCTSGARQFTGSVQLVQMGQLNSKGKRAQQHPGSDFRSDSYHNRQKNQSSEL